MLYFLYYPAGSLSATLAVLVFLSLSAPLIRLPDNISLLLSARLLGLSFSFRAVSLPVTSHASAAVVGPVFISSCPKRQAAT
jgi:hypothetical protein